MCPLVGQFGAVSCLDINADGSRLLCGYSKGLVRVVYDMIGGAVVITVDYPIVQIAL